MKNPWKKRTAMLAKKDFQTRNTGLKKTLLEKRASYLQGLQQIRQRSNQLKTELQQLHDNDLATQGAIQELESTLKMLGWNLNEKPDAPDAPKESEPEEKEIDPLADENGNKPE
jgi:hypothetical protein